MEEKDEDEDEDKDERKSDLGWREEESKCVKRQQDPSGWEASQHSCNNHTALGI